MIGYYSGIGARTTPPEILELMRSISSKLAMNGYILRSGGAIGADSAFEAGCDLVQGSKVIYRADDASPSSIEYAAKFHKSWNKCSPYVKKLHGRNAHIILGPNLDIPSSFVICWTKNGKDVGGTGLGIRIANSLNITVINLFNENWIERLSRYCEQSN